MPFISVVLLVHGVEDYLAECLESILSQPFPDFEVIAVNDCSPDQSSTILADYAARDRRVRVVTLEENVGQGLARNAGLAKATGEYVWFLDGDDWIRPGALQVITDRLRSTEAEIVVFGWERIFPNGHKVRGGQQERLASAPDKFNLTEYPKLAMVAHFPWNKVVRRGLIDKHHYQFGTGIYEDIDFSYFMLATAGSITALETVLLNYRQRETGATRELSDRHFSIFCHWSRTWTLYDEYDFHSPEVRRIIFAAMVRHFVFVFNHPSRIQDGSRKRYVSMARNLYQKFRPHKLIRPSQFSQRVENAAVAAGAYPVLEAMRRVRAYRGRRRGAPLGGM